MIQHCAVYDGGVRRAGKLALEDASEASTQPDSFAWVDLHEPGADEFTSMTREFGLPRLAVEDAVAAHQRPKLERYGDLLFVVLKTAIYVDSEEVVRIGEIMVFLGQNFVVVVRHGQGFAAEDIHRNLDSEPELLKRGPAAVLHAVVDDVVDRYSDVVAGVDTDVGEVEEAVFSDVIEAPTQRIYLLSREVLQFQHATAPLADPLAQLAGGRVALVDGGLPELFRDVQDNLLRVLTRIDSHRDLLSSVLQANLAQVGIRQNSDMRKISAWVAIAAVPTLVAGIYGMNFDVMPELRWAYGYPLVLSLMGAVCFGLYRSFRHNNWL